MTLVSIWVEAIDHHDEAVALAGRSRRVLRVLSRLGEVTRHPETVFFGEPLRDVAVLGIFRHRSHMEVDVVDLETRMDRALDLRSQLLLDFFWIGVIRRKISGRRKEVPVFINERWHCATTEHWTPSIIPPL